MKFTSYAQTDTGQVRQLNEDNMRIVIPTQPKDMSRRGELFVVADGMGGHDAGEVASSQAVETITEVYYRKSGEPDHALKTAIEEANAVIFERAQKEDHHGMGTTVVVASRIENRLYIAHVGDSRLYLIRGKEIYPLTDDHSLVAEQIKAGILTPEEALNHPLRNVISRAVGTTPTVEVEVSTHSPLLLEDGDVVLLCSDGLTEHVRDHQIVQIVSNRSPKQATKALINAANRDGGRDNITVIMGIVGEVPEEDEKIRQTIAFKTGSNGGGGGQNPPGPSGPPQPLGVRKRSRASKQGRGSVFWLRAFLLFIIVLGIGGAAISRFGPNFGSLISVSKPSSPTPTVTTTIELPVLPTFTKELKPIDPTVVAVPITPSATFTRTPILTPTLTPTTTATKTALSTSTPRTTATSEPSATPPSQLSPTATSQPSATTTPDDNQVQSGGNQEANLVLSDTINTNVLTPTLTIASSSNQASRPTTDDTNTDDASKTPEPSESVVISVTLTVSPAISSETQSSPTVTVVATERTDVFRPSSISNTPIVSQTVVTLATAETTLVPTTTLVSTTTPIATTTVSATETPENEP